MTTNDTGKRDENEGIKPLAVTIKSACRLIGVGRTTMWKLIRQGRVKTTSVGRRQLVTFASLEALVSNAK